jgi:hypothetical protein
MTFTTNLMEKPAYIFKGESSWSREVKIYRFPPSSEFLQESYSSQAFAVLEVQELLQKLAKVENIRRARAVAPNAPDLHIIDIELELQPETELSAEAWDKIQDLVIESEWKLRDDTEEKWFFNAEEVEAFSKIVGGAEVVGQYPIHRSKMSKTSFSVQQIHAKDYNIV